MRRTKENKKNLTREYGQRNVKVVDRLVIRTEKKELIKNHRSKQNKFKWKTVKK